MLVTNIFSFFHNVFKRLLSQIRFIIDCHHTSIFYLVNPFPNKPWFLCVCSTSLSKTLWEKEKLLITSNFSFPHSVFYHLRELSTIFTNFKIVVCKLFQFGRVQNLSFGKELNVIRSAVIDRISYKRT